MILVINSDAQFIYGTEEYLIKVLVRSVEGVLGLAFGLSY